MRQNSPPLRRGVCGGTPQTGRSYGQTTYSRRGSITRHHPDQWRQELGIAGHGSVAADERRASPRKHSARQRYLHNSKITARTRRRSRVRRARGTQRPHPGPQDRIHRSALRSRQNDARVGPRSGSASGTNRQGTRLHAWRLRDWRAAHQPSHQGVRKARRADQNGARIRRSKLRPADRNEHRFR